MNLDNLLARLFSNQVSDEEKEFLESWKREGEENLQSLKEMTEIWGASEELQDYKEFDKDSAWRKLNSAIVSEELQEESPKPSFSIGKRLMPIAASLVLLVALGFGVKHFLIDATPKLPSYLTSAESMESIQLADNSKVILDYNSSFNVLNDFDATREVKLSGRAFFDVQSNEENPFMINTEHGMVMVMGTQFTLETSEEKTEIKLLEGKVMYSHEGRKIEMSPGEAILVSEGEVLKYRFDKSNAKSWVSNELIFESVQMSQVFKTLKEHFDTDIIIQDKFVDGTCKFSSKFKGSTLSEILEEISGILDIEYSEEAGKIIIKKLSC
jgi:ferric-dicitrate binding protein FerR (iron transport regulator)